MGIAIAIVVTALICLAVAIPVSSKVSVSKYKTEEEQKIGSAQDKAREIIDEALKTAEAKKREATLEAKEETIRVKNELDKETKERRSELQRLEKRVLDREENVERKSAAMEKKEASLAQKESVMDKRRAELDQLQAKKLQELERISGLTSEQAKEFLLKSVEEDVKHEKALMVKEMDTRAKEEANKKAKEYIVSAIQKCAADHVSETTVSSVQLPPSAGTVPNHHSHHTDSVPAAVHQQLPD